MDNRKICEICESLVDDPNISNDVIIRSVRFLVFLCEVFNLRPVLVTTEPAGGVIIEFVTADEILVELTCYNEKFNELMIYRNGKVELLANIKLSS